MDRYLHILAKEILKIVPDGLSKVRFAKVLYFTHKGLVQNNLVAPGDMEFIRMPLGPVPVGFRELAEDRDIRVTEVQTNPLVFDKQLYTLTRSGIYFSEVKQREIDRIVGKLIKLTTNQLVEIAHQEPSWIGHKNGDEYILEEADLALPLPIGVTHEVDLELENQHLQAKLVEGMLDEIVEESTSLEYSKS